MKHITALVSAIVLVAVLSGCYSHWDHNERMEHHYSVKGEG